eukprot:3484459-Rhodomonas_salina.3
MHAAAPVAPSLDPQLQRPSLSYLYPVFTASLSNKKSTPTQCYKSNGFLSRSSQTTLVFIPGRPGYPVPGTKFPTRRGTLQTVTQWKSYP